MELSIAAIVSYSKCSKISNTFFSNQILVFWAGIHKMFTITNREDPDQTAFSVCLSMSLLAGN